MQKFLTLLITIAILYILIQEKFDYHQEKQDIIKNNQNIIQKKEDISANIDSTIQGSFLEKTLSKVALNILKTENGRIFFENLVTPMKKPVNLDGSNSYKINNNNFLNSFFRINTFDKGEIGPAICGQVVTIHYKIFSMDNTLIEENDKTYTLGFKPILPGIDSIVVGMMQGQTRQAILAPQYAFSQEKYRRSGVNYQAYYKVSIRLDNIISNSSLLKDDIKIFDDEISYKMPLICGSHTSFDVKITKISNGQIIYDSQKENKKLNMLVGDINYPLIFSYSLFGKVPVGSRTVIFKGKTFKGLTLKATKFFQKLRLPEDEYFMLELKNFDPIDESNYIN